MRLWSIHPTYLDSKGFVALWREGLLAQAVLHGRTVGYREHPELDRFKDHESPKGIMFEYLQSIFHESLHRKYQFDWSRVIEQTSVRELPRIPVPLDRIKFEWEHSSSKLKQRSAAVYQRNLDLVSRDGTTVYRDVVCNPIFEVAS